MAHVLESSYRNEILVRLIARDLVQFLVEPRFGIRI